MEHNLRQAITAITAIVSHKLLPSPLEGEGPGEGGALARQFYNVLWLPTNIMRQF